MRLFVALARLANTLFALPFVVAILIRSADVLVFDVRIGWLVGAPAVACVILVLLLLVFVAAAGKPLKIAGFAALMFAIMKYQADETLATPKLECSTGHAKSCIALVTCADSAVGFAVSEALLAQGHKVILGCRDHKRCQFAKNALESSDHVGEVYALAALDASSLTKVSMFAFNLESTLSNAGLGKIDIVILISAAVPLALQQHKTAEGFEMGFGTTYIAHFALLKFLNVSALASRTRVVVVSSDFMRFGSFHNSLLRHTEGEGDLRGEVTAGCASPLPLCIPPHLNFGMLISASRITNDVNWGSYPRSRLAEVLFARELARQGVAASAVSPGMVFRQMPSSGSALSELQSLYMQLVLRSPHAAAAVVLTGAQWDRMNGGFLNSMGQVVDDQLLPLTAADDATARRLWEVADLHVKRWDQSPR